MRMQNLITYKQYNNYYNTSILIAKMTKRARLTTQEVLEAFDYSDEEDYDVGNPDEPFMEGSDDDFSDLDGEEDNSDNIDVSPPMSPLGTPARSSSSASPQSFPQANIVTWTRKSPSNHFTLTVES